MRAQGGSWKKKEGVLEFIHGKKTKTEKRIINVDDFREKRLEIESRKGGECQGMSSNKEGQERKGGSNREQLIKEKNNL